MTGQDVASQCRLIFSEYGWPDTLVSDNGPCYTAETFTSMMKEYGVDHITSSPHYLESNGLGEKFVHIVKNMFNKPKQDGKDTFIKSNDIPQYSLVKQFTISDANLTEVGLQDQISPCQMLQENNLVLDSELCLETST